MTSISLNELEIDSKDIIRLMLQFLKENDLKSSFQTLQQESGITLNILDDIDTFLSDIQYGRWETVLPLLSQISLPKDKIATLYEHIIFELLEHRENELAREILKLPNIFDCLKDEQYARYARLENLCHRPIGTFHFSDAFENSKITKDIRRLELVESIQSEIARIPPSRLLSIIGQSLKYQISQGLLPENISNNNYDLLRDDRKVLKKDIDEKVSKKLFGQIKFDSDSHPETSIFAPDGSCLVTGSIDGFVEVWDYESCKLRTDLDYQARDELMMHEDAILCCSFSKDSKYLVTGSQSGQLKIWKISSGSCQKKFNQAHSQGITSVSFSKDNSHLLTSSYDSTVRVHGLKSGKTLREFRGHTSFVNGAIFSKSNDLIISCSADGSCKIWDAKTTEIINSFRPNAILNPAAHEEAMIAVVSVPNSENILVCSKSSSAYLLTIEGNLIRSFSPNIGPNIGFTAITISPRGKWVYCSAEDGNIYVFDSLSGTLEDTIKADEREIINVMHHPHRNLIITLSDIGQLKLWKG